MIIMETTTVGFAIVSVAEEAPWIEENTTKKGSCSSCFGNVCTFYKVGIYGQLSVACW